MVSKTQVCAAKVIEQPRFDVLSSAWILFLVLAVAAISCKKASSEPQPQLLSEVSKVDAEKKDQSEQKELVATFAGGCFWCTEAVFERMDGINDVVSGYIGGHVPNPTYRQVCGAQTGHAEAVEIYYDPAKVNYEELLDVFFKTHDPTTLNRQGPDSGPQYRSSVFFHNEDQRKAAEKYIKKLDASGEYDDKIVTLLEKASTFYPAEEYHQDFFRRNPGHGYCRAIVAKKVRKFKNDFGDKIKK
jgi:peptide-methionine (S)-S-oxide reductase